MIRNIVFDFGGVLVEYDFPSFFAQSLGGEEQARQFMAQVFTEENNSRLDKADKSFDQYMAEWKRQWPQYAREIDIFDKRYTDIFTSEVPGIAELMGELKAKGYRLLGLSNWSTKVFDVMRKFPKPFALLDGSLISHQVRLLKPDQAIYEAFCRKFGVKPADCLFIDDKAENIEGAQRAGWHGVVFTTTEQLRRDLKAAGVL